MDANKTVDGIAAYIQHKAMRATRMAKKAAARARRAGQLKFRFRKAAAERKYKFSPRKGEHAIPAPIWGAEEEARKAHVGLLDGSLAQMRGPAVHPGSELYQDIVSWVECPDEGAPFSFATCCRVAGEDAQTVRERFAALALVNAARAIQGAGRKRAAVLEWMDAQGGEFSFLRVCELLGRDPDRVAAALVNQAAHKRAA